MVLKASSGAVVKYLKNLEGDMSNDKFRSINMVRKPLNSSGLQVHCR